MGGHSGNEKPLFTQITVNIWVPKDVNIVGQSFNVNDILDDEPEKMERL